MIKTWQQKPYTRTFILIFFLHLSFFLAINCLQILPAYLEKLGASKVYIGIFMNMRGLALIIYVLFLTKYLTNKSRKIPLLLSYLVFLFCLVGMSFSYRSLNLLFLFTIISSVPFALGFTMHVAIIHAIIPDHKRVGLFAVFGISGLLSNPLSAFISERFYLSLPPYLLFLPSLFFCTTTIFILFFITSNEAGKTNGSTKRLAVLKIFTVRSMTPLVISSLVFGGSIGVFFTYIPNLTLYALAEVNIFYFFSSFSFLAIGIRIISVNFIDTLPAKGVVITGLSAMLIALILTHYLNTAWMLFLIGFLYGIGHGLLFPIISSSFVLSASDQDKHTFSDAFLCIHTLGITFLTPLVGILGDLINVSAIFLCMAGIVLITILYLIGQKSLIRH